MHARVCVCAQDLLTGFHLVDGVRRIIMLEGLSDGAMRIIRVSG